MFSNILEIHIMIDYNFRGCITILDEKNKLYKKAGLPFCVFSLQQAQVGLL